MDILSQPHLARGPVAKDRPDAVAPGQPPAFTSPSTTRLYPPEAAGQHPVRILGQGAALTPCPLSPAPQAERNARVRHLAGAR